MDSIEEGIRNATICLADISTDNPNVWYELGYAFAVRRSVIMVCSKERGGRFPFDIRDRTIIEYASDSRSDFDKLRNEISKRAKALVKKIAEQPVIEVQHVTPTEDLKPDAVSVLRIVANETPTPATWASVQSVRRRAMREGLTGFGFVVAIQSLKRKGFVELDSGMDENADYYEVVTLTDSAWAWLERTQLPPQDDVALTEDDIPF